MPGQPRSERRTAGFTEPVIDHDATGLWINEDRDLFKNLVQAALLD